MVRLFYAVVGEKKLGSVIVAANAYIEDVQEKIAQKSDLGVSVGELMLYTTKRVDGVEVNWLAPRTEDLKALLAPGALQADVAQRYIKDDWLLDPADPVGTLVTPPAQPGTSPNKSAIHILVVVPPSRKRPPSTPSDALEDESPKKLARLFSTLGKALLAPPTVQWALAPTACPKVNLQTIGSCLRIPRHYFDDSGVKAPMTKEHALLYVRQEVINEWNDIQHTSVEMTSTLWIVGSPGVGKSCAAFAFACSVDRSDWDVLWIHYARRGSKAMCVKFVGDKKETCVLTGKRKVEEIVESILEPITTSTPPRRLIVFFDGYNGLNSECADIRDALILWQEDERANRRLVCVTSMSSAGKEHNVMGTPAIEGPNDERILPDELFTLTSCTIEDYFAAVENDDFALSVRAMLTPSNAAATASAGGASASAGSPRRGAGGSSATAGGPSRGAGGSSATAGGPSAGDVTTSQIAGTVSPVTTHHPPTTRELAERKFYLAGGSARAMFGYLEHEVIKSLRHAATCLNDVGGAASGNVGVAAQTAINRLFAVYPVSKESFETAIVSQFAARILAVMVGPKKILDMTRLICVNPAMDGFAFEAFVLASGHTKQVEYMLKSDSGSVSAHKWEKSVVDIFDPAVAFSKLALEVGWNVPTKWNQDGYDAVVWKKSDNDSSKMSLAFMQMTRSKTHSFTPDAFVGLLHKVRDASRQTPPLLGPLGEVELCFVVPKDVVERFRAPISQRDFKRQVVDVVFLPDKRTERVEIPKIECSVRVVGVKYPAFTAVRNVWESI